MMDNLKEKILATAKFKDNKGKLYLMRACAIIFLYPPISALYQMFEFGFDDIELWIVLILLLSLAMPISLWWMSNTFKPENSPQMYITKTRIYGQYLFRFRRSSFDFPIEKITAVQTANTFMTKSWIYLSSGGERVLALGNIINADELKHAISNLIKENSEKVQKVEVVNTVTTIQQSKDEKSEAIQTKSETLSSADEIKKFKELYDQGIITEEEFNAKKRQLLGL